MTPYIIILGILGLIITGITNSIDDAISILILMGVMAGLASFVIGVL